MAYKEASPQPVPEGGTGLSTNTAYSPIVGGTSSTAALQNATTGLGTSGFVLTSAGAAALPIFKVATGSCMVMSSVNGQIGSTLAARFCAIGGGFGAGEVGSVIAYPCIAKNLYVRVITNASTTDTVYFLRQNGNNTAITTTVTALTTGVFSDTNAAHSVQLNAGDIIDWSAQKATTGNITGTLTMQLVG